MWVKNWVVYYNDVLLQIRDVEATADRLEVENSQLKSLTTSQQEQIEETSSKIKQLQESVNDAASDEMSDLYRELNAATALSVSSLYSYNKAWGDHSLGWVACYTTVTPFRLDKKQALQKVQVKITQRY